MAKQLIVVVHGVGVKDAGISADLLATALDDTPENAGTLGRSAMEKPRLRPHSSDDFHQREFKIYSEGGKRQVFPARIRRYRQYDAANDKAVNERVIADFYWGDIGAIGGSSFDLVRGFLTTVLGLSHIVRESAREVFRGNDFWNRTMRWLANVAVLTIHGPIAAINIVLLAAIGCSFLLNQGFSEKSIAHSGWVTGLLLLGASIVFGRRAVSYLGRHLWLWTGLAALAFLVFGLLQVRGLDGALLGFDLRLVQAACHWPGADGWVSIACDSSVNALHILGLRLLRLMDLAWLVVLVSTLVIFAGEIFLVRMSARAPTSLVMPALTLMILLWILLTGSAWAVLTKLLQAGETTGPYGLAQSGAAVPHKYLVYSELGMLVVVLFMLAVLGIIAVILIRNIASFIQNTTDPKRYLEHPAKFANSNRLIVARAVLAAMDVFFMFLILSAIHRLAGNWLPDWIELPFDYFQNFKTTNVAPALLIASAIVTALLTYFGAQFRAGLGIATDVITYLNNYSWKETALVRAEASRAMPMREKYAGYWPRERIRDRLKVLVDQLIADEDPDELAIVSHSQGTVVAMDVLDEHGRGWLKRMKPEAKIALVTMGSPYAHVHNHYFPTSFNDHKQRTDLLYLAKGGILSRWINIFRIDDFVGTYIDPDGQWPREHPVPANGHTYYWVDENVFPVLKEFLDFRHAESIEAARNKVALTPMISQTGNFKAKPAQTKQSPDKPAAKTKTAPVRRGSKPGKR